MLVGQIGKGVSGWDVRVLFVRDLTSKCIMKVCWIIGWASLRRLFMYRLHSELSAFQDGRCPLQEGIELFDLLQGPSAVAPAACLVCDPADQQLQVG